MIVEPNRRRRTPPRLVTVANDETIDTASASADPAFDILTGLVAQAIETGAASGEGLGFVSREAIENEANRA